MARKPKLPPQPDAAPVATPVEAPVASPAVAAPNIPGPRIEYFGEGADQVIFTVNPKASHIRVYAGGQIVETLA